VSTAYVHLKHFTARSTRRAALTHLSVWRSTGRATRSLGADPEPQSRVETLAHLPWRALYSAAPAQPWPSRTPLRSLSALFPDVPNSSQAEIEGVRSVVATGSESGVARLHSREVPACERGFTSCSNSFRAVATWRAARRTAAMFILRRCSRSLRTFERTLSTLFLINN
jgi:hypothetical protein